MTEPLEKASDDKGAMMEKRRHPRQTVFKTALLYPVVEEANLSVENVSHAGLSGRCALSLGLHQQVHVSFDDASFRTAEVRWINGSQCGLLLRSEEHTSELQSLMRLSYAVFCLKTNTN